MLYDYTEYIDSIRNLAIRDYYIVTGIPGSRTDLVVGWLSACHPQFHNNNEWSIDPSTGASMLMPSSVFNQESDNRENNDHLSGCQQQTRKLQDWISRLPPTTLGAVRSVVGKSHMRPWSIIDAIAPDQFVKNFRIVVVDTTTISNTSLNEKLTWEFLAKTFLSNCRKAVINPDPLSLKKHSKKIRFEENYRAFLGRYSTEILDRIIFLDYEKLIVDSGGDYICDQLDIVHDKTAIATWKKVLPLTHTNDVVRLGDQIWSLPHILSAAE